MEENKSLWNRLNGFVLRLLDGRNSGGNWNTRVNLLSRHTQQSEAWIWSPCLQFRRQNSISIFCSIRLFHKLQEKSSGHVIQRLEQEKWHHVASFLHLFFFLCTSVHTLILFRPQTDKEFVFLLQILGHGFMELLSDIDHAETQISWASFSGP